MLDRAGRPRGSYHGAEPKWRNWQTRRTQNPVPFGGCGFDPHLRHFHAVSGRPGRPAGSGGARCETPAMRVGILTGGGDCPGLNAVIRAVARRALRRGDEVIGIRDGWRGLVEDRFEQLGPREISGILPRGGTILGTTRTNPFRVEGGVDRVLANFQQAGLDALVAIG